LDELSLADVMKIVDNFKSSGCTRTYITPYEPETIPHLLEFLATPEIVLTTVGMGLIVGSEAGKTKIQ